MDQKVDELTKNVWELASEAEPGAIEKSKHELSNLESLLNRDKSLHLFARISSIIMETIGSMNNLERP